MVKIKHMQKSSIRLNHHANENISITYFLSCAATNQKLQVDGTLEHRTELGTMGNLEIVWRSGKVTQVDTRGSRTGSEPEWEPELRTDYVGVGYMPKQEPRKLGDTIFKTTTHRSPPLKRKELWTHGGVDWGGGPGPSGAEGFIRVAAV